MSEAPEAPRSLSDHILGKLLLEHKVAPEHIHECLRLQADAVAAGQNPPPRLGELLVQKGYATPEVVSLALAGQKKSVLVCSACGKRYNVTNYNPANPPRCKACPGELVPAPSVSNLHVDGKDITGETGALPSVAAPLAPPKPKPSPLGKYTIIREVGRGGMGVVYEALDTALNRKVALKLMIPSQRADPEEVRQEEERFVRECRLSANLSKYPHIVSVYEAGILEGRRYMAMEFIQGRQMQKWAKDAPVRDQIALLRDVALAAHHAHESGIIHRDLKPANVLVDAKNEPHVTDFGLAKAVEQNVSVSLTAAGMVMGTPAYMSPEQAKGLKTIDRRADVYSLGVMLYETLAGRPPFEGATAIEILMKTVKNAVPAPSTFVQSPGHPAQDKSLENICLKALAKNAAERYATAKALADDVTKWLQGEEVKVVPPKSTRRNYAAPGRSRSWVYAAAAAGVALVAIVGLVLAGSGSPPAQDPKIAAALAAARAAEEAAKAELERFRRDAEAARKAADAARVEEGLRSKAEATATERAERERLERERKRLEAERLAAEQRVREAEEAAARILKQPTLIPEPVAEAQLQPGLLGEYFDGIDFLKLEKRRVDRQIVFDSEVAAWGFGQPDRYSVRWTGYLKVPRVGRYVFETRSDDGVRVVLGEKTIIKNWLPHPPTVDRAEVVLGGGFYRLVVEYYQGVGAAIVSLSWKSEEASAATIIGPQYFFHAGEPAAEASPAPATPATPPPAETPVAAAKPALPEAAAVKEAEKVVQEMFKADYARKANADRQALAQKLLRRALETYDDAALRYVLLREAADVASKVGDLGTTLGAFEEMARRFPVVLALKRDALQAAARAARSPEEAVAVAEALLHLVDEAVEADDYEVARAAATRADAAARAAKDEGLLHQTQGRAREVAELDRAYGPLKGAEKTLQERPDDPAAHLASGRYYCLKGDWPRGVAHLAKGSDRALKAAAERDLSLPTEPPAQLGAGEAWWELSERSRDLARSRYLGRALHWYQKAWPGLRGLEREKARERARTALASKGAGPPPPPTQSLSNWTMRPVDPKVLHVDERYARSGKSTVRLTPSSASKSGMSGLKSEVVSEGVPGDPRREYQVSAWVLADGTKADQAYLIVTVWPDERNYYAYKGPSAPADHPFWTQLKFTFTSPEKEGKIVVGFRMEGQEGQTWVDDFSLKEVGSDKELLRNTSLERR